MDDSHVMHLKHDNWFTILTTVTCHKPIADKLVNILYFVLSSIFCHHRPETANQTMCMSNSIQPGNIFYYCLMSSQVCKLWLFIPPKLPQISCKHPAMTGNGTKHSMHGLVYFSFMKWHQTIRCMDWFISVSGNGTKQFDA